MQYMKRDICRELTAVCLALLMSILLFGCEAILPKETAATPAQTEVPTEAPTVEPTPEPTFEQVLLSTPGPTAEPTPEVTPEPESETTPAPTPGQKGPAPTPFSIVWMSDTQNLTRHYPEVFNSMRDWILNEREAQNIVFFVHTGDVVDGCSQTMWDNASIALIPILYQIPGIMVSGNHDVSSENKQKLFYERPYARMTLKEGQSFQNGECAYQNFTAGGDEFLVFGFGYKVNGSGMWRWVSSVIEAHPNAVVLFVMHDGLQPENVHSGQAKELLKRIAETTPNAKMLLCGHNDGFLRHEDLFDDDGDGESDRCFYTLMFNVQDDVEEGLGYMRILTFYPEDRHIEVKLYSPWFNRWDYPKALPEENGFILENAY